MAINQWDKKSTENGPNAYKKGNRTDSKREVAHLNSFQKQRSEDIKKYREMAESQRSKKVYNQERLINMYVGINKYIKNQKEEDRPLTVSGLILAAGTNADSWYNLKKGMYDYRLVEYQDLHPEAEANIYIDNIPCYLSNNQYTLYDIYNDNDLVRQKKALESVIMLTEYSTVIQKALMLQAEQVEERLYSKGRVGDIFALKAQHNWRDDNPNTVNNTLVIADKDQARRAIDLLK